MKWKNLEFELLENFGKKLSLGSVFGKFVDFNYFKRRAREEVTRETKN